MFPLSALSLTEIKLALNFSHSRTGAHQCMTWYSSSSQAWSWLQELKLTAGTSTWPHSLRNLIQHTQFFTFHYDKEKLKDVSTALTTVQGVKPTLLPRPEPVLECSLCQWQQKENGIEDFSFSTMSGKGPASWGCTIQHLKGNPSSACRSTRNPTYCENLT